MNNPFKAPSSKVVDPRLKKIHESRPGAVTFACQLLWITIGLALLSFLPGVRLEMWPAGATVSDLASNLIAGCLFLLLEAWLINLVYLQRNWARWVLLALLALGWVDFLFDFNNEFTASVTATLIDLLSTLFEMAACYQLFISPGRRWFELSQAAKK